MDNVSGPLWIQGNKHLYSGSWCLSGETLEWDLERKIYRIQSGDDLSSAVKEFLRILSKKIFKDQLQIRACLSCRYFSMSAMAKDMGRGQRGVCKLHCQGVEICHLCDDYILCE